MDFIYEQIVLNYSQVNAIERGLIIVQYLYSFWLLPPGI